MNGIQPPGGILELPGMRGKIVVQYDITRGGVTGIDFGTGTDIRTGVQILLMAVQHGLAKWIEIDSGIIRPKGDSKSHDQQEAGSKKADDDDDGRGAAD
jgi:hypothetical protein